MLYEYKKLSTVESNFIEELNKLALDGWRVLTVAKETVSVKNNFVDKDFFLLERLKQQ